MRILVRSARKLLFSGQILRRRLQASSALEIPKKVESQIVEPQYASVLARPIFLVSFPPIDIVTLPKTCSTHALIADLMRFSSLASSLRGRLQAPFSWIRLSEPPRLNRASKHSPEYADSAQTQSCSFSGSSTRVSIWLS